MIDQPRAQPIDCTLIAQEYLRDEPAFASSLGFGPFVQQGCGKGPAVLIGDQSEISLLGADRVTKLDHRMALLARNGDTVLVRNRETGFETYLADCLGLMDVTFVQVDNDPARPVAEQIRMSPQLLDTLAQTARENGGLTIKAYLTTGNIWRLAQTIGEMSKTCIHVCGPSPRATLRANDKLWFTQLVQKTIGVDATPPTHSAYGPAAVADLARTISRDAGQVIVKVPDSAGSAGNIKLNAERLHGMSADETRQFLLDRLHAKGWQDSYPILVGVWDDNVSHNPSVQMWIPQKADGPPQIKGIFEQRVQGDAGAFVGAARSVLPAPLQDRLSAEAARIARVLQHLGYFGLCSLDAVICETPARPDMIHWIECNGRWGGVSIPMLAAAQRLPDLPAIAIVQEVLPGAVLTTEHLRRHLADLLFQVDQNEGGIVIISPCESARDISVNLMAIADTQDAADEVLAIAMRRLAAHHDGAG